MSHFSRQNGAFGSNKPRPIQRVFVKNAPAENLAPNQSKEPTIADKLILYAQPVLEEAGNNHTAAKGAMNIAVLIWNATIEGEDKVAQAKQRLAQLPGATPEQAEELVSTMVQRKNELYPAEKLVVTNFVLKFSHRRGTRFQVSAVNINPEGFKKSDLADIVKVTFDPQPAVATATEAKASV
jgi:hypothetical protein